MANTVLLQQRGMSKINSIERVCTPRNLQTLDCDAQESLYGAHAAPNTEASYLVPYGLAGADKLTAEIALASQTPAISQAKTHCLQRTGVCATWANQNCDIVIESAVP